MEIKGLSWLIICLKLQIRVSYDCFGGLGVWGSVAAGLSVAMRHNNMARQWTQYLGGCQQFFFVGWGEFVDQSVVFYKAFLKTFVLFLKNLLTEVCGWNSIYGFSMNEVLFAILYVTLKLVFWESLQLVLRCALAVWITRGWCITVYTCWFNSFLFSIFIHFPNFFEWSVYGWVYVWISFDLKMWNNKLTQFIYMNMKGNNEKQYRAAAFVSANCKIG